MEVVVIGMVEEVTCNSVVDDEISLAGEVKCSGV
jgi:hypothetical protein